MATVSKEEYLKKYLSGNDTSEKKKKKKKRAHITSKSGGVKIVDDDIDFKTLLPDNLQNTLEEDIGDHDPTVADFIDERPKDVQQMEKFRNDKRWKVLADDASDSKSTPRQRHDSDSDHLPSDVALTSTKQRKSRHDSESDSDHKPQRRKRHDSDEADSDHSPVRKRHDSDSDHSPVRKSRHDSDSDSSPRRGKVKHSDSDNSPPRKIRHDSDSDNSLPYQKSSPQQSRKRSKHSDLSPPRKRGHASDSDQSPPRKRGQDPDSDQSPPRKRGHGSDSDQSPPRKRSQVKEHDRSSDRKDRSDQKQRKSRWAEKEIEDKDNHGRAKKTLGGAKAGLSSAKEMIEETKRLRAKEDAAFKQLDEKSLGKGAATVVRDKRGRRRNMAAEEEEDEETRARKAAQQEQYDQWGKGLKQQEEEDRYIAEALHEVSKPLARGRSDADLDAHLKAQDREGDPMLAFMKKKKEKTSKNVMPVYKGPEPPPNRFGIRPGYRWDGVDRSCGFEKQFFAKISEKHAMKEIAHKWSVEDM